MHSCLKMIAFHQKLFHFVHLLHLGDTIVDYTTTWHHCMWEEGKSWVINVKINFLFSHTINQKINKGFEYVKYIRFLKKATEWYITPRLYVDENFWWRFDFSKEFSSTYHLGVLCFLFIFLTEKFNGRQSRTFSEKDDYY